MLAQQEPAFTPVCLSGAICGWGRFAERRLPNRTSLCEAAFSPSTPRALHIDPVNNWLGLKHHCTITRFAVAVITHLWAIRLVCWPCFCSPDKKKRWREVRQDTGICSCCPWTGPGETNRARCDCADKCNKGLSNVPLCACVLNGS